MISFNKAMENLFDILADPGEHKFSEGGLIYNGKDTWTKEGLTKLDGIEEKVFLGVKRSKLRRIWRILLAQTPSIELRTWAIKHTKAQYLNTEVDSSIDFAYDAINVDYLEKSLSRLLDAQKMLKEIVADNKDQLNAYMNSIHNLPPSITRKCELSASSENGKICVSYKPKGGILEIGYDTYKSVSESVKISSTKDSIMWIIPLLSYHIEKFGEASNYLSEILHA